MFKKVLIANRGAIACRIIRTLRRLGIASVAVYSEADADALHVELADESVCIGPASATESYLCAENILAVARSVGAEAIHPGYGFLSEHPDFAEACEAAGIVFIGPTPQQMRAFGLKHTARALAREHQVPLLEGSTLLSSSTEAIEVARSIGYPVMLKSTAGGGGIGMRLIGREEDLPEAYLSVERLAKANFKEAGLYLEKYVQAARHVEVQVFGDGEGSVLALGERDCSVQRRNQKVIEETPAPGLSDEQRTALHSTAIRLMEAVSYRSAGTVEFVLDSETGQFYFLEVNTRLQVEHGVTEEVSGIDLVEWMVQLASGDLAELQTLKPSLSGASIQVRLYAEDPARDFQPSSGILTEVVFPDQVRIETAVVTGSDVPPYYDPMLAKLIVHAQTRELARQRLVEVLQQTHLSGIETNLDYLRQIVASSVFIEGRQTTRFLGTFQYQPSTIEILDGGVQTTIQDYPGRLHYWDVGVPPSGPMDALAFRVANRLVGNTDQHAGLECTMVGPTLRFHMATVIAITGAPSDVTLDGVPVPMWQSVAVPAGSVLKLASVQEHGCRSYLAIAGGIDVPEYLGSRATFTLGQFGGHAGRTLRVGDVLHIHAVQRHERLHLAEHHRPGYTHHWEIGVLYGPHGAPDFFTAEDIELFFGTDWKVHYNSSRTGVRLIGPKPVWARTDGGEAGLHPSNIHDNAYAIGAVDFTGDMPVILGPDGPSLGGFVCPAVVVQAELWKLGQLRPGDTLRFINLTPETALDRERYQEDALDSLSVLLDLVLPASVLPGTPVLATLPARDAAPAVVYRQAGDRYLLVEYGPLVLDLVLRMRVHVLMDWLNQVDLQGILDLTPGIRSLQIHFDSRILPRARLLDALMRAEAELPSAQSICVPSRTVWLPLSWNDSATRVAIEKYMKSVRPDAPWCPSNIEFIRRINGVDSVDEVMRIVFEASYLVLGLGDVYLGAPVATPVDPCHRLVTTKYNPARTWTPENAVGIGGAYMCVYGMEGPGGYQFVGRTLQMWNRYRTTADFEAGKPWLLRFFDQIRFYPVTETELLDLRRNFLSGRFSLRIEEGAFSLSDYLQTLQNNAGAISAFKQCQQIAFDAERERWRQAGQESYVAERTEELQEDRYILPEGASLIKAHVPGSIWKIMVEPGSRVCEGDPLMLIESMKMELMIHAPADGEVLQLMTDVGAPVTPGQDLLVLGRIGG